MLFEARLCLRLPIVDVEDLASAAWLSPRLPHLNRSEQSSRTTVSRTELDATSRQLMNVCFALSANCNVVNR
jgi:hypothetical protein